jgi:hypothetical protein
VKTIEVLYSCPCFEGEAKVKVPERRDNQDVADWVGNTLGLFLTHDHKQRSPRCTRTTMAHVKIPMGLADGPQARHVKLPALPADPGSPAQRRNLVLPGHLVVRLVR